MDIMLEKCAVTGEMVKTYLHDGKQITMVELRHHHSHDWGLFHARGALLTEAEELVRHLEELPRNQPIVIMSDCPGSETSIKAARMLEELGVGDVHWLSGGFDAYLEAGLPVIPASGKRSAARIMLL
jgi:rhodanese-related sulfurtransferase